MSDLKEYFNGIDKKGVPSKAQALKTSKSVNINSFLYFMIPIVILLTINVFFFSVITISLAKALGFHNLIIATILLSIYGVSRIFTLGKMSKKINVIIVAALHSVFLGVCIITLFIPVFPIYVKALLLIWCLWKTKYLVSDLSNYWRHSK